MIVFLIEIIVQSKMKLRRIDIGARKSIKVLIELMDKYYNNVVMTKKKESLFIFDLIGTRRINEHNRKEKKMVTERY